MGFKREIKSEKRLGFETSAGKSPYRWMLICVVCCNILLAVITEDKISQPENQKRGAAVRRNVFLTDSQNETNGYICRHSRDRAMMKDKFTFNKRR